MSDVLKSFIRLVLEAPLADMEPLRANFGVDRYDQEALSSNKVLGTSGYKKQMVKYLGNVKVPIYVVPVLNGDTGLGRPAIRMTDQTRIVKRLIAHKVPVERAKELTSKLDSGASIWLVASEQGGAGFEPTAWMTVHAMFDLGETDDLFPSYLKLIHLVNDLKQVSGDKEQFKELFYQSFTMGSARNKKLNGPGDVAPEIATQAIMTKRGIRINPTNNVKIDDFLHEIVQLSQQIKDEFADYISGALITTRP